jgi:predicted nucleic acid-binding protein
MTRLLRILGNGKVGLDTSVLIYYFNRHEPYFSTCREVLLAIETGDLRGVISVVSEMELMVAPLAEERYEILKAIEDFLRRLPGLEIIAVSRTLTKQAAALRAQTRLRSIDALVAATAIAAGCTHLVGNDKEFAHRITGINYLLLKDYA